MLEKLFLQEESKILREEKHLAMTEPGMGRIQFPPRVEVAFENHSGC